MKGLYRQCLPYLPHTRKILSRRITVIFTNYIDKECFSEARKGGWDILNHPDPGTDWDPQMAWDLMTQTRPQQVTIIRYLSVEPELTE